MVAHDFMKFLADAAILLPAFLMALSFHEYAHAFVATFFGDPTARRAGRLTLNPAAHIDPTGLFCLILFRFGWAKPVPFNHHNFKHPKLYAVLTALAGPLANLILALIMYYLAAYMPLLHMPAAVATTFITIFEVTAYVNVMLGVFNLLPLPPLDGSHLLTVFFEDKYPRAMLAIYQYSFFILIIIFVHPQTRMALDMAITAVVNLLKMLVF
ncbi:MAG: site-2 protease family protein [Candidatus Babeliales bacterium]